MSLIDERLLSIATQHSSDSTRLCFQLGLFHFRSFQRTHGDQSNLNCCRCDLVCIGSLQLSLFCQTHLFFLNANHMRNCICFFHLDLFLFLLSVCCHFAFVRICLQSFGFCWFPFANVGSFFASYLFLFFPFFSLFCSFICVYVLYVIFFLSCTCVCFCSLRLLSHVLLFVLCCLCFLFC